MATHHSTATTAAAAPSGDAVMKMDCIASQYN